MMSFFVRLLIFFFGLQLRCSLTLPNHGYLQKKHPAYSMHIKNMIYNDTAMMYFASYAPHHVQTVDLINHFIIGFLYIYYIITVVIINFQHTWWCFWITLVMIVVCSVVYFPLHRRYGPIQRSEWIVWISICFHFIIHCSLEHLSKENNCIVENRFLINYISTSLGFLIGFILTMKQILEDHNRNAALQNPPNPNVQQNVVIDMDPPNLAEDNRHFINLMRHENRQVMILFGSQSGTAEELAGRLAQDLVRYGQKALVMDPEKIVPEDFERLTEIQNSLLILCVATYGEGDPTDNARKLYEYLRNHDPDFSGLRYAVFALGNKKYEHYNAVGKFFDDRLEELGAERVFEIGLGDDGVNLEVDFMRWREEFLPALVQSYEWEVINDEGLQRQYRLQIIEEPLAEIFTGEYGRIGAYERQRGPYNQKNPYLAKIVVNKELHASASERSCRHIEFNIGRIRYEAGDHLAVFPSNDSKLVDKFLDTLNAQPDTVFKLINTDEDSSKDPPFPCPCTFKTALTHYVDICAPVKCHVLKALVDHTTDEAQKKKLNLLCTANEEGFPEYAQFIGKERRSIIDILEHFDSCKPPVDLLLELLPRLQPRYYCISSSPKVDPNIVSITAAITKYSIDDRLIKGVCTHYLSQLKHGDTTPIFVRKSTMRLPHRPNYPVIMIGSATDFAPFRGFLQERSKEKSPRQNMGPIVLLYDCRHPEHDYIYQEEILKYKKDGVITDLDVVFSHQVRKVQHLIWEHRQRLWDLIQNNANIYVFGDARNVARDVQNTFLQVFQCIGKMEHKAAQKLFKDLERQRRYQADVWS